MHPAQYACLVSAIHAICITMSKVNLMHKLCKIITTGYAHMVLNSLYPAIKINYLNHQVMYGNGCVNLLSSGYVSQFMTWAKSEYTVFHKIKSELLLTAI